MKEYLVTVPVEAKGYQTWLVNARSEQDAIARVKKGGGDFDSDELEVQSCDYENAQAEVNE